MLNWPAAILGQSVVEVRPTASRAESGLSAELLAGGWRAGGSDGRQVFAGGWGGEDLSAPRGDV